MGDEPERELAAADAEIADLRTEMAALQAPNRCALQGGEAWSVSHGVPPSTRYATRTPGKAVEHCQD